jgi:hypothetical protein
MPGWRKVFITPDTPRVFVFDFKGFAEPSRADFGFIHSLELTRFHEHILFAFRESKMSKLRTPYPEQSCQQTVELIRTGCLPFAPDNDVCDAISKTS